MNLIIRKSAAGQDTKMVVVDANRKRKTGVIMMNYRVKKELTNVGKILGVPVYTNGYNYYFEEQEETTEKHILTAIGGMEE